MTAVDPTVSTVEEKYTPLVVTIIVAVAVHGSLAMSLHRASTTATKLFGREPVNMRKRDWLLLAYSIRGVVQGAGFKPSIPTTQDMVDKRLTRQANLAAINAVKTAAPKLTVSSSSNGNSSTAAHNTYKFN